MPLLCGIDHGTVRIGLALGDTEGRIASPLTTVDARGAVPDQIRVILKAVADYDVHEWVVGLPLNMDDTEGPQAKATRAFAEQLAATTGQPVHLWDERLSSLAADELLAPAELTHKKTKARRDRVAAQVILQTYLDAGAAEADAPRRGVDTERNND